MVSNTDRAAIWPHTRDIVLPRDPQDREPDKIADLLATAARPWLLVDLANLLRNADEVDVPRKMEAEVAAALHWVIGFVVRDGEGWHATYSAALDDLKARAAASQTESRT
jgi:hypothetical protein